MNKQSCEVITDGFSTTKALCGDTYYGTLKLVMTGQMFPFCQKHYKNFGKYKGWSKCLGKYECRRK